VTPAFARFALSIADARKSQRHAHLNPYACCPLHRDSAPCVRADPPPLEPSSYDRTCTQNSDCVSSTLPLEACVCASAVVALSDEGFAA